MGCPLFAHRRGAESDELDDQLLEEANLYVSFLSVVYFLFMLPFARSLFVVCCLHLMSL